MIKIVNVKFTTLKNKILKQIASTYVFIHFKLLFVFNFMYHIV